MTLLGFSPYVLPQQETCELLILGLLLATTLLQTVIYRVFVDYQVQNLSAHCKPRKALLGPVRPRVAVSAARCIQTLHFSCGN